MRTVTNYQPGLILILTCDSIHLDSSSDVDVDKPDEKSIMTYVAQFLKHHPDRKQSDSDRQLEEEVTTYQMYLSLDTSFIVFFLHPLCFVFFIAVTGSVSNLRHNEYGDGILSLCN